MQDDVLNDKFFGLLDYGARFYDPQLGRWHSPDVLGELRYNESPYCYVGNNPISRFDPDGRLWGDKKSKDEAKASKNSMREAIKATRLGMRKDNINRADGKERIKALRTGISNRIMYFI